jgi:hypothetical protein
MSESRFDLYFFINYMILIEMQICLRYCIEERDYKKSWSYVLGFCQLKKSASSELSDVFTIQERCKEYAVVLGFSAN